MSEYSLKPVPVSPGEFLGAFFEPAESVCLRIFSDRPDNAFSGQKLKIEQGHFDKIVDTLKAHNEQNRGIYFVINYGGHEDSEITRINAQFMECDNISLEEQLAKIQAFPLEASLIVRTRKSLHCYWLMKNAKAERFRAIQKRLIAYFGADPACVNESRVFRLPGFLHCKEEPVLVECIKFNPELRYTQKELEAVLPELPEESEPPRAASSPIKDRGTQKGLVLMGRRCAFIQHCKRDAKTLSEPDWYAMISNLAVFEGGEAIIHRLSKPYPAYDYDATQAKIDHFYQSGTKPMTCRKIAEHGFVCPKMRGGSCTCKSPAGLAFHPMSVEELKKALASVKTKQEAAVDIHTARRFINDYLYNIDPGIAGAFIGDNIKNHFKFKAADLKTLPAYQKELYKAFSATQEARKERRGNEIPAWYEVSEKGKWNFLPGVLADHCAENEHVFYCADSYYFYENGVYLPKNDKTAQRKVRSYMNARYALAAEIRDADWQWQVLVDKTVREINVNPYIMNFKNGLYNVMTDEFLPHDPKYLSTIRLGGNYNPEAQCPIFMRYLSDILPESEVPLIQEILGYFLVPVNKAQKSFVIVGKGDSGKSTFLSVVQDVLLGADNVSTLTWQALDEKFATVQLFGKLANVFADLPSENIRDTGTFKAITGEDYISAQHKFKEYFSFKPFARLLFSCNSVPKSYTDRSDGFYRRLMLIRFDQAIPEDKRDPNLKEKLAAEADGILAWSMAGLRHLKENSYRFSETQRTKAELASYKAENSSALAFVGECCEIKGGYTCMSEDLFSAYQEYCSANALKPVSQIRFNRELEAIQGLSRGRDNVTRRHVWVGVRLSE
ncbi:phage/plasmid primase, P4 family [Caproicibacter fermentans]|uniref:phage/plasmid primase, P4 family n=1 Tax=Caproicibacter fermentans TaxID=2576756 RepID=UPI001E5B66A1|nr:phage/plasmid primase, P4 family [Caproicibacter fermentans]